MKKDKKDTNDEIKSEKSVAPKPEDFDKIIKEVTSNVQNSEGEAKLGLNKGQLFVRIPIKVAQRLNLKKGDVFRFTVEGQGSDAPLKIEIIKEG